MANPKYTKIDVRFGVIEYPVTLDAMVISLKNYQKQSENTIKMLSVL